MRARRRYGWRVVARFGGRDAGLIGLASTRELAAELGAAQRMSYCIRREAWAPAVMAAVRAQEEAEQIPRGLALSLVAGAGRGAP